MEVAIQPNGTQPQMPSEPPQEVKDSTFTFNPELMSGGDGSTITIDKKEVKEEPPVSKTEDKPVLKAPEEKKVEESKKEEVKKEEPVKVEEKKSVLKAPTTDTKKEEVPAHLDVAKPAIKPITPVKDKEADSFDYTRYAPSDVTNMKNMSRQSREAYAKLVDENKQLSSLKDATYLQHDNAYTLSPKFQELQNASYKASIEGQCWEQSLLNMKAGKQVQEITGFDKNGNPLLSAPKTATDADELRYQQNLMLCNQAVNKYSGELQTYPQQFKQRVATDLQAIQQVEREQFAWVADPKLLDYTVDVDGKEQKLSVVRDNFINMWPPYLASQPGVKVAANLMIALVIRNAELREAQNGKQVAQIKVEEAKRGEPTSELVEQKKSSTVNGKGVPSEFNLSGMPS